MPKVLRIAFTEFLTAVRSKAFILGIVMLPVLMFGGIVVSRFARDNIDIKDRRFAVLDYTRSLMPIIAAKARERTNVKYLIGAAAQRESKIVRLHR